MLARLLLDAGRAVAVDELIDALWGEEPPDSAVKMIHVYVSQLRKALPAGVLRTRAPGYAVELSDVDVLDLREFERLRTAGRTALQRAEPLAVERLRQALALWRGPALAEFSEPFAAPERARLEELRALVAATEGLEPGAEAELRAERERLRHVTELAAAAAGALSALAPEDGDGAAARASRTSCAIRW